MGVNLVGHSLITVSLTPIQLIPPLKLVFVRADFHFVLKDTSQLQGADSANSDVAVALGASVEDRVHHWRLHVFIHVVIAI